MNEIAGGAPVTVGVPSRAVGVPLGALVEAPAGLEG